MVWDTDAWHWESAIYADGGSVLTEDGSAPSFGADYDYVGAYYLKQIKQGLEEGYIVSPYGTPKPADTRDDLFCSGQAAMILTSCNSMPKRAQKLQESGYTLETYIQPAGRNGDISLASGGSNWVMCNTASYEELMFGGAFIAYLAEEDQVLRVNINTGSMFITNSAYESEKGQATFNDYPYTKSIYDSVPYLHERPNTSYWTEMYTYAVDKLEQFTLNPTGTDIEAMIDDIEMKFAQIIKDNTW
jgi:sn-glycerol 3-phosphate transport system substrate-binding protein